MQLSLGAIKKIMGIGSVFYTEPKLMAQHLTVTIYPGNVGDEKIAVFSKKFEDALRRNGVKIVAYPDVLIRLSPGKTLRRLLMVIKIFSNILIARISGRNELRPAEYYRFSLRKFFVFVFGKKIRPGVAVIKYGESTTWDMPIDKVASLKFNPIVNVLLRPCDIHQESSFLEHMDTALKLFTSNMANIVITVDSETWTVYSLNMSYPTYKIFDGDFDNHILNSLITKISAPVIPPMISEFLVNEEAFNPGDLKYKNFIKDIISASKIFGSTKFYPAGKDIKSLDFRNYYYRLIGSLYLDNRNGMSYGFLARQLPTEINAVIKLDDFLNQHDLSDRNIDEDGCFMYAGALYVVLEHESKKFVCKVPEVWVLTTRSGADKTRLNPLTDIVKMGLVNGRMVLDTSLGVRLTDGYRPSFDSRVILAHAVSNAIYACLLKFINSNSYFAKMLNDNGVGIAHWHGYINPQYIPIGYYLHGFNNPSVSCSALQGVFYVFMGKYSAICDSLVRGYDFRGDIQVEPQHGTNIVYESLDSLASYLCSEPEIAGLGNSYFDLYK